MRGCQWIVAAGVLWSAGLPGCGGGDSVPAPDAAPDAPQDTLACPPSLGAAWLEVSPPTRSGALLGAGGDVLITNVGERGQVSVDGGATWYEARNPGPQDAGPIYRLVDAIEDPRDGSFWIRHGAFEPDLFVSEHVGAGDFEPSTLGWPIAPDYASGGELHERCVSLSSCAFTRRAPVGGNTTLLEGEVLAIATFAADPQRILVVMTLDDYDGTLRLSVDGGATFDDVAAFAADSVYDLVPGPGPLEAWVRSGGTVAHTVDGGETWVSTAIVLTSVVPDRTIAGAAHAVDDVGGLHRTSDGGQTWAPVATPYPVHTLTVPGDEPVIQTMVGLLRSAGGVWTEIDAPFPSATVDDFTAAGDAWIVNAGGALFDPAWRSVDGGATWTTVVPLRFVEVAAGDPDVIYARSLGEEVRSTDRGATWTDHPVAFWIEAVGADPDLVYGYISECDDDVCVDALVRSRDGGATYDRLEPPTREIVRLRPDPLDEQRVYVLGYGETFSEFRVLRSDDQGDTWTTLAEELWGPFPDRVTAGRVWRITDFTLGRSDDAGETWTELPGGPDQPIGFVVDVDGRPIVFDQTSATTREIWTYTDPDGWQAAGIVPVPVGGVAPGDCGDALAVMADFTLAQGPLYVTRTLGREP